MARHSCTLCMLHTMRKLGVDSYKLNISVVQLGIDIIDIMVHSTCPSEAERLTAGSMTDSLLSRQSVQNQLYFVSLTRACSLWITMTISHPAAFVFPSQIHYGAGQICIVKALEV